MLFVNSEQLSCRWKNSRESSHETTKRIRESHSVTESLSCDTVRSCGECSVVGTLLNFGKFTQRLFLSENCSNAIRFSGVTETKTHEFLHPVCNISNIGQGFMRTNVFCLRRRKLMV
jgi:hypothetical protein